MFGFADSKLLEVDPNFIFTLSLGIIYERKTILSEVELFSQVKQSALVSFGVR